jgi:hypothetical protein
MIHHDADNTTEFHIFKSHIKYERLLLGLLELAPKEGLEVTYSELRAMGVKDPQNRNLISSRLYQFTRRGTSILYGRRFRCKKLQTGYLITRII